MLDSSVFGTDRELTATFSDSGSLLSRTIGQDVVGKIFASSEVNKIAYFIRIDDLCEDTTKQTAAKGFQMYDPLG